MVVGTAGTTMSQSSVAPGSFKVLLYSRRVDTCDEKREEEVLVCGGQTRTWEQEKEKGLSHRWWNVPRLGDAASPLPQGQEG